MGLNTNSDEDADAGKAVDDAAIAAELKKDDDFKDVTVEAPTVTVEEVEVEEVIEEASADDAKETTAAPIRIGRLWFCNGHHDCFCARTCYDGSLSKERNEMIYGRNLCGSCTGTF